jgi:CubicO group peptidase (beta-lactamase class C family)
MTDRTISRRELLAGVVAAPALAAVPAVLGATTAAAATDPGLAAARGTLARYVPSYLAAMNAPGLTLALATRDGTTDVATFGVANLDSRRPVDANHLFQIGSITKSFVALVLLQLADERRLEIDRPVLDYLPWLPIEEPYGPVTLHHLLTHSSGMPGESPLFPPDGGRLRPAYAPGRKFWYSNWAFDVLGHVIEKVDGRSWPESVERRIFAPLGMRASAGAITPAIAARAATGHVPRDAGPYPRHGALTAAGPLTVTRAAGSIAATPGDMARYLTMLLRRGATPDGRLVSEQAFERFATPYVAADEFGPGIAYGYGIAVEKSGSRLILRHTGGMVSFMSSLQADLEAGCGAFASINAQQGYRPNRVTRLAIDTMRAHRLGTPAPKAPAASERMLEHPEAYAGDYAGPDGRTLSIAVVDGSLTLRTAGREIPLDLVGADQFVATAAPFDRHVLVFDRAPATPPPAGTTPDPAAPPPPVIALGHGGETWVRAGAAHAERGPVPAALAGCEGTYRSDDPWLGALTVVARGARLWLSSWDGTVPLEPVGMNLFRAGDDPESPDQVAFAAFVDGRAQLMRIGGVDVPRSWA